MTEKLYTLEEVKQHNQEGDAWLVIEDKVYDISKFASLHPAGKNVILEHAGQDATKIFRYYHAFDAVTKKYEKLVIGRVQKPAKNTPPLALFKGSFGEGIPFGDPSYIQGWKSPYYDQSHIKLREAVREFIKKEIEPFYEKWDEDAALPNNIHKKCAEAGWLALGVGQPWPIQYFEKLEVNGVKLEQPDIFHESIILDEVNRMGSAGLQWGILAGTGIGLPPVIKFGSEQLKERIVGPCLRGDKLICLAITEPYAGSDVANLQTTAKLTADGKYYIVNGLKKWITNGIFCDYFTTAVRTGGPGMEGLSLLVIDKNFPGVQTRKMKCQGALSSGTTFIIFEKVKVPAENLIGKLGKGFKYIMHNFNHERLCLCIQSTRMSRVCLEESMKYAQKVIRSKLANMVRQVESLQSWLEHVMYNYKVMDAVQKEALLSGAIALLKVQASTTLEYCAREAVQIFGGLGYTRGGQGGKVERIYREVRVMSIPGGSEEIMLDLGIRQAQKFMPKF